MFNPVEWSAWLYGKLFLNHPFLGFLAVVIFISIVTALVWFKGVDKYNETHKKSNPGEEARKQPVSKPKTLRDLFQQDFPDCMKITQERTLTANNGMTLKIEETEYANHEGRSKFLGFYIPMSPISYAACELIANNYKQSMAEIESKAVVIGGHVSDSAKTSSKDLIFSGRIFIYHEDNFSLQQLASLENLFQSKGVSVVFRGHAHLLTSWGFKDP